MNENTMPNPFIGADMSDDNIADFTMIKMSKRAARNTIHRMWTADRPINLGALYDNILTDDLGYTTDERNELLSAFSTLFDLTSDDWQGVTHL